MLGQKEPEDGFIYNFRLDDYVPEDHILRIIDQHIDFEFIRNRVKHLYSHTGKPSVDPIVLIKMLLIGYLFDVKSERQLEKDIQVNLAYRWFIKYGIEERIPDHSTISQTRRRKFSHSTLFQDVFDEVVRLCIQKGCITGETILTDSTPIKANASLDSLRKIDVTPREYIARLEENSRTPEESENNSGSRAENDTGKRYSNNTHRSSTDPDSRILYRKGKESGLYYAEHRSIDISGYITDVYVTDGTVHGDRPYISRLNRQRFAFGYHIHNVVADRQYGTGEIYKELTHMGLDAYIPELSHRIKDVPLFSSRDFIYDRKRDVLICPAGQVLKKVRYLPRKKDHSFNYRGSRLTCGLQCIHHERCLKKDARWPKEVQRSMYQDYTDRQTDKKNSPRWNAMLRKRKTLLEGSFGDAKNNHGLRRAKFRGREKVQEQSLLTAVAQNLKRLVKDLKNSELRGAMHLKVYANILLNNWIDIY